METGIRFCVGVVARNIARMALRGWLHHNCRMETTVESREAALQRYLDTGDYNEAPRWAGTSLLEAARNANAFLREGLIAHTLARLASRPVPVLPLAADLAPWVRGKVSPMVEGLFPATERGAVLALLERSVVFVGPGNVESVLRSTYWPHTAWSLANMVLAAAGCEPLSGDGSACLGLSEETTCYVSQAYFAEGDPFADFVVHEAAHVFHNCKRATVGLPETRLREWLLDIDFRRRETFAYACEAYSRIRVMGNTPARRLQALQEHAQGTLPGNRVVNVTEYLDILDEAARARNGWKVILRRCAPARRTGRVTGSVLADAPEVFTKPVPPLP
ncbi:hypothetical protein [Azohydromonas aeria]|uniref:hypothetical protein n=1 Tax=Azohydromonas aeria TaxID=2590212 RepID=UPI0012F79B96|nr:hypothetical protein [Azohydromonas aeria]